MAVGDAIPLMLNKGGVLIASLMIAVKRMVSPPLKRESSLFHFSSIVGLVVSSVIVSLTAPVYAFPARSNAE